MAGRPYATTRSGRSQWLMQRVSAFLLIFFAFVHFGLQHFTTDATSTGLLVSARLSDPYWQSFYVIFVILVLYHGINGVMGIVYDYAPERLNRFVIATLVWTLGAFFAVLGVVNIVDPSHGIATAKVWYAENGFPDGESAGSPPTFAREFEFGTDELRELHMLAFYLRHHTHRTGEDPATIAEVFAADSAGSPRESGRSFDLWALGAIAREPATDRDTGYIFASTREFALWAAHVRRADARRRAETGDDRTAKAAGEVLDRLAGIPPYRPVTP